MMTGFMTYVINTCWSEDIITWNNRPFPELTNLLPFTMETEETMGGVYYYIDITHYAQYNLFSFMLLNEGDYECKGYSKEYLNINNNV